MFTWSCFNYFWLFSEIMLQIIITIIANVINFKHLELGFYMSQNALGKISSEQLRKVEKNQTIWSQQSSKKKMPHFDHFPRPGESDPYENIVATKLVLRGGDFCDRPLEAEGAEAPRSHARFRLFFSLPQKLYIRIFL